MLYERTRLRRPGARPIGWRWTILALAAIGALIAHIFAPELQVYRASTTILVGAPIDAPFQQVDDMDASENLARVLADIIPQEQVLSGVIERLAMDSTWRQLQARVQTVVEGTSGRLIRVTATAGSATEAEAIVREIPRQLKAVVYGPGGPPNQTKARGFMWSRMDAMQRHIVQGGSLVGRWEEAFMSMYRNLEDEGSADHVEVVEAPATISGPVPPELWLDIAAAAAGALIALLIAGAVEFSGLLPAHARRITARA